MQANSLSLICSVHPHNLGRAWDGTAILCPVEPRDRVLGPIAEVTAKDKAGSPTEVAVDFGALLRKLVVSEQLVIQSIGLRELPFIVAKFGYDGAKALLESGRVRLLCEVMFTANIGQYTDRLNGPVLPLGSYSFSALRAAPTKEMLSADLHQIDIVAGINQKQARKLRHLAGGCLTQFPDDGGQLAEQQYKSDLTENVPMLKVAVALAAYRATGVEITTGQFDLRVERLTEWDWRTTTDLGSLTGLSGQRLHTVVGSGLSAVCAISLQLEIMRTLNALSGFQNGDLPLLEKKFEQLARQLDPDAHEDRFDRVCEIAGLPDVSPDPNVHDVDLPRLLEVTMTPEAGEFRRWLRGIDSFTNKELADAFHPLKDALGAAVRSRAGKVVRLATTTGVGVLVPPAGIGLGVLDTFLTEKILPGPGPTAFLSRLYPSIFEGAN
jgi:hypothetical protein